MINFELEDCKQTLEYFKGIFGVDIKVNDNNLVIEAKDWDVFSEVFTNSLHLQDLVMCGSRFPKIKELMENGTVFTFSKEEQLKPYTDWKIIQIHRKYLSTCCVKDLKAITGFIHVMENCIFCKNTEQVKVS